MSTAPAPPIQHARPSPPAPAWAPTLAGHLPVLDGLRGIAILAVILYHYLYDLPHDHGLRLAIYKVTHLGQHGVDLFFVLSGFLITGILLDSKRSPRYFTTFYARRTLRIFPLYYGVLFVVLVLLPRLAPPEPLARRVIAEQGWLWLYAANLLMGWRNQVLFNGLHFNLGHFWTLAVEEQFYLIWPLLTFALGRRALAAVCLVCLPLALAIRWALIVNGNQFLAAIFLTPCRVDALAVGALIAVAARGPGGLPALRNPARWTVALAALAWAALLPNAGGQVWVLKYTPIALLCGGLLCLALNAPPSSGMARFLSARTLQFFGKYSYGLYVFHYLLYPVFQTGYAALPLPAPLKSGVPALIGLGLLSTAGSVAVAWASWHLYEKQFLKLKARFRY